MLETRSIILPPESTAPILIAVVDTEEQFDWEADFDRDAKDVTAIRDIWRIQELFEEFDIRPTYVVDFPIASQQESVSILKEFADSGRAGIGAHLQPWVNPPFEEKASRFNSYQGNLGPELERAKLNTLVSTIEQAFGHRPVIHKAGRYGLGPHTAENLDGVGIEIDLSPASSYDFSADGGPDFRLLTPDVYWFGPDDRLLGIPATGGFIGPLQSFGPSLYCAKRLSGWQWTLLARTLSRTRLLERILLSPEGHTTSKLTRLTSTLVRRGYRIMHFSFHSPSARPGAIQYVQTESDLREFLDACRYYLDYFLNDLKGRAMSPIELRDYLLEHSQVARKNGAGTDER